MVHLAIFASGDGTNAENLIRYFSHSDVARVVLVVCNRREAEVMRRAERLGVPTAYVPKAAFEDAEAVMSLLRAHAVDSIVLAGFLLLVPRYLTAHFRGRIVNVHPSLLPLYGGKGMFGRKVHEAVVSDRAPETGITVHEVDEAFDRGRVLFQARCKVAPEDSPAEVERRVHALEYEYFPRVVEQWLKGEEINVQ